MHEKALKVTNHQKMQFKITISYYLTLVRMAIIKKTRMSMFAVFSFLDHAFAHGG